MLRVSSLVRNVKTASFSTGESSHCCVSQSADSSVIFLPVSALLKSFLQSTSRADVVQPVRREGVRGCERGDGGRESSRETKRESVSGGDNSLSLNQ